MTRNKLWKITWMSCTDLLTQNSRPDAVMLRENNYFCSLWHQCGDINVRPGLLNPAGSGLEQEKSPMTFRATAASWSMTKYMNVWHMIREGITNTCWCPRLELLACSVGLGVRGHFNAQCRSFFFFFCKIYCYGFQS